MTSLKHNKIHPELVAVTQPNKEPPVIKISNSLIEAYKGYYEEEKYIIRMFTTNGIFQTELFDEWVKLKIISDSPRERLERYLEWNSILGYSETIYNIAIGKIGVN